MDIYKIEQGIAFFDEPNFYEAAQAIRLSDGCKLSVTTEYSRLNIRELGFCTEQEQAELLAAIAEFNRKEHASRLDKAAYEVANWGGSWAEAKAKFKLADADKAEFLRLVRDYLEGAE